MNELSNTEEVVTIKKTGEPEGGDLSNKVMWGENLLFSIVFFRSRFNKTYSPPTE